MDPLTSDEFAAYVGIDGGDQKHDVCLRTASDEKPEFSVLSHKPEVIDQWVQYLLQRFGGKPIAVALEQSKGPLIHALMKYAIFVLFPINPQAFALSRAKDDPTDSALALEILCKHQDQLRALRPQDSHTRALAQVGGVWSMTEYG